MSDHFDGRRFFNPAGGNGQPLWRVLRLMLTPRRRWPRRVPVTPTKPPKPRSPTEIVVTFVGHSTFLIQGAGSAILLDPVWSERASPL